MRRRSSDSFNTTGGELEDEEVKAAVELLIATTGAPLYRARLQGPAAGDPEHFSAKLGWVAVRALPFMDPGFRKSLAAALSGVQGAARCAVVAQSLRRTDRTGTWGGSETVAAFAVHMYFPAPGVPRTSLASTTRCAASITFSAAIRPPTSRTSPLGRYIFETDRIRQQSRRLQLHSRRHDSGRRHHPAGLSGAQAELAVPMV
jgi:hypothetical protein